MEIGIGDRIKKIIERRDWKQAHLAKKLGINKSVMSRIIAGTRPVEDSLLLKLTEVLGVSADHLLGREGKNIVLDEKAEANRLRAEKFSKLPPERQEQILELMKDWVKKDK